MDQYINNIIELFEVVFRNFGIHQIVIKNLYDLLNEFEMIKILEEIEPDLMMIAEVNEINLSKNPSHTIDKNKNLKIANFNIILECLTKYFHNCPTKDKLKENFNIKKIISVDEIFKFAGSQKQVSNVNEINENVSKDLVNLAEILIVLSAVSTKRTEYLDHLCIISESEEKYLNNYLMILEKYLNFQEESDDKSQNANTNIFKRTQNEFINRRKDNSYNFKKINIYDKNKNDYLKSMEAYEKEISELNRKNEELTDELLELEMINRDILRENESLKYNNTKQLEIEQDSYNDAIQLTQLKNELMKKELEIEDLKRDHDLYIKRLREENAKLYSDKERLEDKVDDLKNVKFENEKYKLKIKEFNLMKEKFNEYENMASTIEIKNRQIENFIKEKQNFIKETENLIKENLLDKEKIKEIEFQKKKLEYEFIDLKKEIKNNSDRQNTTNYHVKSTSLVQGKTLSNTLAGKDSLNEMKYKDQSPISGIILEHLEEQQFDLCQKSHNYENEYFESQKQYEDLDKSYREQIEIIHKLNEEKSELLKLFEKHKFENDSIKNQTEKVLIEKEKVEISKQKLELELNKSNLNIDKVENDKLKLLDEMAKLKEKNKTLIEEKNNNLKDAESMKVLLKMKNNQIEKLLSEKKKIIDDNQNTKIRIEKSPEPLSKSPSQNGLTPNSRSNFGKFTPNNSNSRTGSNVISAKNSFPNGNMDILELKAENSNLKTSLLNKDESIKTLKERIKHLEKVESIIKSKENKVKNDLQHYKNSYEDQKARINQEHELLSNNLCDLAMQFIVFKNELLKNVKPSILNSQNDNKDKYENDDE